MNLNALFQMMVDKEASDIFLRAESVPCMRIHGKVQRVSDQVITQAMMNVFVNDLLKTEDRKRLFHERLNLDFTHLAEDISRFRINMFVQRGAPVIVGRMVHTETRTFEELNLPHDVLRLMSGESRGMFLACGPAGNGKSTCISTMLEYINQNYSKHIITIEDPIEFVFADKQSFVNQRELEIDVQDYPTALKYVTQQSPDVIYIGNIRDEATMRAAIWATELGTFLLSTLHTVNAVQSIMRMVNFFPAYQREEVRAQMAEVLRGTIALRLIPRKDGQGRVPAFETMVVTPTIAGLIREGRIKEIQHYIDQGQTAGMQSFHQSLVKLVRQDLVDEQVARSYADSKAEFDLAMKGIKV